MKQRKNNLPIRRVRDGLTLEVEDQGNTRDYLPLVLRLTHENWKWKGKDGAATFEDAVSESILALLQVRERVTGKAKLITYAYRRIKNAPKDLLKVEARYSRRFVPTDPAEIVAGVDSSFEDRMSNAVLWSRVHRLIEDKLTGEETIILVRYYFHERTEREIAEELRLKAYKVPQIRNKALQALRSSFRQSERPFVA